MADDIEPVASPTPWAALLPGLDSTVMGWRERHWYLGDRWEGLFDRNGNAGPTVWWCGRVAGGWGQRPDGAVVYRLTEDVGADGELTITERAQALETWLSGVRVTPRFPHSPVPGTVPLEESPTRVFRNERRRRERNPPPACRRPPRLPGCPLSPQAVREE